MCFKCALNYHHYKNMSWGLGEGFLFGFGLFVIAVFHEGIQFVGLKRKKLDC